MISTHQNKPINWHFRVRFWYIALLVVFGIIFVRLFYLQVLRHEYYKTAALAGQYKEYEIPADRGVIEAHDGDKVVPIVLNEEKYTLFVDPKFIKNPTDISNRLAKITGGNAKEYEKSMKVDSRYSILKKKLSPEDAKNIDDLEIPGVGTRKESYRTYPQGAFASQVLGFVNDEGKGNYGIEQGLDETLRGEPGHLNAITDAQGVPLVANSDNVISSPKSGDRVVLTLDISMQQQLEQILEKDTKNVSAKSSSALIMDPYSGEIKAMANYPSYDPGKFYNVKDAGVFTNGNISSPLEVGSIMKPLTMAAALNQGVISRDTTFYDPGVLKIDGAEITNVEEVAGAATRPVEDILRLSLNTGATWLLMQMGGGTINKEARNIWHDYMVNKYRLGQPTNIEQGYEQPGYIPDPNEGYGLDIQYANAAFGQGMSATPIQMAGAISSVLNGGTYYQPTLIDKTIDSDGNEVNNEPKVVEREVVKPDVGKTIQDFMVGVVNSNYSVYGMDQLRSNYLVGGKTGTAQITKPEGGYYTNKFNGLFMGFVGGEKPEYVIIVRVNEPNIVGYAGSQAAGPVFSDTVEMLINNFAVTPKQ